MAKYKKRVYICTVEEEDDGIAFKLEDGRSFKSPSSAGSAVMDGKAVNGWRFWSIEAEAPERQTEESKEPATKSKKSIYRLPNQQGVAEGFARYWCNECQRSFLVEGSEVPAACPEGHRGDQAA
jgi:hypothetical protein